MTTQDGTWHRVHPLTPLVRGWVAVAATAYFVGREWFEWMFRRDAPARVLGAESFWVAFLLLGALLLALVGGFVLSWWFTRYQVTETHVRVESGILFRTHRQARLDRVQAIDLFQPLLGRVLGLAELKFEVADAGESAVHLEYLSLDSARELRARLLAPVSHPGVEAATSTPQQQAPEEPVVSIPARRVMGSLLLSGSTGGLATYVFVIFLLTLLGGGNTNVLASALVPGLLTSLAVYWRQFSNSFGFRATLAPDGAIRLRYGLLDTRVQTVPRGRVQAIAVSQPLLWRLEDWYRIQVNVAGYGVGTGESEASTTVLPVGTRDEVMRMLSLLLPDPGTPDAALVYSSGLSGAGDEGGFIVSPRRVRWLSPLTWRRNGFFVTATALLARSGRLTRTLTLVPHARIQSMALQQGPLARALRVADLRLHTTVGPVRPVVHQVDLDVARRLFDEQSARAASARRRPDGTPSPEGSTRTARSDTGSPRQD